jgi:heat shock protein HslJ
MRRTAAILILALLAYVLFVPALVTAQTSPGPTSPPTLDELKTATYSGIPQIRNPVTLQDGRWTGSPATPGAASRPIVELAGDFRVVGDVDGDGNDDSVVVLTYSSGGSGSFSYLAVMARKNGSVRNIATAALGDRVQLRSVRISNRKLLVSGVRAGVSDAACCPGELVDWEWKFNAGKLTTPGAQKTGRLSLAVLAKTEWVLRSWDITEPAAKEPTVTLAYDAGRITGTSGCNRYSAGVTEGKSPGELEVGLIAGTRMACPGPQSEIESRFLEQLSGARTFGFMLGRLTISYARASGSRGSMLFDLKTPAK